MRSSIKLKSSLFLASLLLLTVFFMSMFVMNGIIEHQLQQDERSVIEQAKNFNFYIRNSMIKAMADPDQSDINPPNEEQLLLEKGHEFVMQFSIISRMDITLYTVDGKVIGKSSNALTQQDVKKQAKLILQNKMVIEKNDDQIVALAPINIFGGPIGITRLGYSLVKTKSFFQEIQQLFLIIGSSIFLCSFLLSYFYFRKLTHVISKLSHFVGRITKGDFQPIILYPQQDELGDLSRGISNMSQQIENQLFELKKEEEKLNQAVTQLKALQQQQKEFIGNISHEFKTPLSVILAYVDLVDMYADDPQLREEANQKIKHEAMWLTEMIEKVLYSASLEKYDFESNKEWIDLKQLLENLYERICGKAQRFQVAIKLSLQETSIWAERESLTYILMNVLDNAVKYNRPKGKIQIKTINHHDTVKILVQDTGIGIPDSLIKRVFDPFFTVQRDQARKSGGIGLGLSLVKQLVEKQSGTIQIKSVCHQGTEVMITFPLQLNVTSSKQL